MTHIAYLPAELISDYVTGANLDLTSVQCIAAEAYIISLLSWHLAPKLGKNCSAHFMAVQMIRKSWSIVLTISLRVCGNGYTIFLKRDKRFSAKSSMLVSLLNHVTGMKIFRLSKIFAYTSLGHVESPVRCRVKERSKSDRRFSGNSYTRTGSTCKKGV